MTRTAAIIIVSLAISSLAHAATFGEKLGEQHVRQFMAKEHTELRDSYKKMTPEARVQRLTQALLVAEAKDNPAAAAWFLAEFPQEGATALNLALTNASLECNVLRVARLKQLAEVTDAAQSFGELESLARRELQDALDTAAREARTAGVRLYQAPSYAKYHACQATFNALKSPDSASPEDVHKPALGLAREAQIRQWDTQAELLAKRFITPHKHKDISNETGAASERPN